MSRGACSLLPRSSLHALPLFPFITLGLWFRSSGHLASTATAGFCGVSSDKCEVGSGLDIHTGQPSYNLDKLFVYTPPLSPKRGEMLARGQLASAAIS